MTSTKSLVNKANSLQGCLGHLKQTTGRRRHTSDGDILELSCPFTADEAKLFCSKTWRILGNKTQVFSYPQNAFVRNRQTHVAEVIACSAVTSNMLGLNTDLVRAAAIGHDIGHVPLGHQGEAWMAQQMGKPKFCHEVMGPIITQKIERRGKGLNLTWETLQAMMRHSGDMAIPDMSQEAWVLRYTDKFAYIFADINDIGCRLGYPLGRELSGLIEKFGQNQRERTTTAIAGLVVESAEMGRVSFENSDLARQFAQIRKLMYVIYPCVTQQNVESTLGPIVNWLGTLGIDTDPFLLLALMTDRDINHLTSLTMKDYAAFSRTAAAEIVPYLEDIGPVDLCNPDLDW